MDLGYPMDRPYRPIPPDLAGAAQRIAAFLGGGGRAVVVTGPARAGKRALLDGLLAGMPGRVTRIENRTGLPLALDGVLKQMGKVAESEGDERGLFFRTLAEQAYEDYSSVIAVEDAHTLTSLALTALARAPGLGGPDLPGMILVLTGEAGLLERLEGPGLEGLRNSRRTLTVPLAAPPPAAPPAPPPPGAVGMPGDAKLATAAATAVGGGLAALAAPLRPDVAVGWARGNLGLRGVLIAVLAGAFAAAAGLTWALFPQPSRPHAAAPGAPPPVLAMEPAVPVPPAPVAVLPAEPAPTGPAIRPAEAPPPEPAILPDALSAAGPVAIPASIPEETLRREFDAFLNRAGRDTAKLTPGARESLFREYRQWRAREAGRAP